jgi:DNA polymerase III subunit gamma/tau
MLALSERPFKFKDMIGQKNIIKTLQNSFHNNIMPQVMFFLGESGSGKSTTSYIISSLLNCHNPDTQSNEPCGVCPVCQDVQKEKFSRDIHRINGGDLGKDGVKELSMKISSAPMYDQNKIIIIEEGHLISGAGKEQTLLLLEKPRKNLYFIIISTEKQKFPKTVLDRGQLYNFKAVDTSEIGEYLIDIVCKYDPDNKVPEIFYTEGLPTVIEACGGSVRKAIADTERCLAGELYDSETIESELNYISEKKMYELLTMILNRDKQFFILVEKLNSLEDFFFYSWKILVDTKRLSIIRDLNRNVNDLDWKEKNARAMLSSPVFNSLLSSYQKIYTDNQGYFRSNTYLNYVMDLYTNDYTDNNTIPTMTKKVRKVR